MPLAVMVMGNWLPWASRSSASLPASRITRVASATNTGSVAAS